MYAVDSTGGKQYASKKVCGAYRKLDVGQGASVEFNQVLLVVPEPPSPSARLCPAVPKSCHRRESWQGRQGRIVNSAAASTTSARGLIGSRTPT